MPDYGLGRVPSPFDIRDRSFPMSLALAPIPEAALPDYRYWTTGPVLNQGSTPHCVGFSWAQWRYTSPVRSLIGTAELVGNPAGHDIYAECKKIDGYPGDGSYVRTAAQVMQNQQHLLTYLWAETPDQLKRWILTKGPVVVGTNWHERMFDPDADGTLHPEGPVAGGHAYLIIGYSTARKQFRMINSWSKNWGQNGRAWIGDSDLWSLVANGGEAVTSMETAKPA